MLVPPKPWLGHNNGGYLYSPSKYSYTHIAPRFTGALSAASVVRLKETNEQLSYLKEADSSGAIELVYACLDVLGRTPWIINRSVFEVALAAWNSGKEYPRIPPLHLEQDIPEPPSDSSDMGEKVRYQLKLKTLSHQKQSNHSDRCSVNYKMEIARSVRSHFLSPFKLDPDSLVVSGRTLLPAAQCGLPRALLSNSTAP
jgi:DNA-directed RNA polymerase